MAAAQRLDADVTERETMSEGVLNRLPPHSDESEAGVLACCLLDPVECIGACQEALPGPEVFYDGRNGDIYRSLLEMTEGRVPVDLISVCQWLQDKGRLEGCGGLDYLALLPDKVSSAANLGHYVDILKDKATLRKLLRTCCDIETLVWGHSGAVAPLLDRAEAALLAVRGRSGVELREPKVVVDEALAEMERLFASGGALTGLPSGLVDLDDITGGFQPEMYVISGYTSTGKSSLAMQFAAHVALDNGTPAGVFSLEMDAKTLMIRTILGRAGVDLYELRAGRVNESEFSKLKAESGAIIKANNLWIDESSSLTIDQMRAKARRMVAQHGVKLLVVDQVSLVEGGDEETRQLQVDRINLACQQMSRELKLPVFAIAQLNDKGDLRESRAGGQHAGGVLKIIPKRPVEETVGQPFIEVDLLVSKLRNGKTGTVPLVFDKPHTKFLPRAKIDPADVPKTSKTKKQPTQTDLPRYDRD